MKTLKKRCSGTWKKYAIELFDELVDVKARDAKLRESLALYAQFYAAWVRAESSRGCYSCANPHDCRCPLSRDPEGKTWRRDLAPWRCECGRDDLNALEQKINETIT